MQFRLSEDLSPGDEVEVWLPRFRLANPDQLMGPDRQGLPVDTRWQAQFVSVASSYLSTARPREGEFGVVLRLNATEGLPRDGFAAVAIATALEGGVDLLPPEDRLRPYRAEGLDDRITLSSTSPNCPLPPTLLRGAPRFGLQGAAVDIYGYSRGARDASIGIPGEPANALLDTAPALDASVELALTFDSSCDLQEGDSITFSLPNFRGRRRHRRGQGRLRRGGRGEAAPAVGDLRLCV